MEGLAFSYAGDELGRMRRRAARRLRAAPLFDPGEYMALHADLRACAADPFEHFAEWGVWEKRVAFSPSGAARALGRVMETADAARSDYERAFEAAQTLSPTAIRVRDHALFGVVCHSAGNYYMRPIAAALANALERAGARCLLLDERDAAVRFVSHPIVVAPHEFFALPLPPALATAAFRLRAVMYNTEQLPSQWFHAGMDTLFGARGVLDINFQSALALGAGMPTAYLLPPVDTWLRARLRPDADPDHPLFHSLPLGVFAFPDEGRLDARPIDIFFAGYKTAGRERFFTRAAPFLAARECFLAYSDMPPAALPADTRTRALFPSYLRLAAATKIVLNIHRYPIGYFEWERMVAQGFSSGACVVATPCMRAPFFEPGRHYFEATSRNLGALLAWLLEDADGRRAAQAAADAGREVTATALTPERAGRFLLSFFAGLDAAGLDGEA